METPTNRTLKQARDEAALEGFDLMFNTFDGGQQVTVHIPGVPKLVFSYEWGEESRAVERIDSYVAEWRHRREDDPRVQHEGVYVRGY